MGQFVPHVTRFVPILRAILGRKAGPIDATVSGMPDSKDPTELKKVITLKRAGGRLPRIASARAWAGNGSGAVCVLCELPIDRGQIEYEVEWPHGADTQLLRFHELCYRLSSEA
jgi:hypothetical protein